MESQVLVVCLDRVWTAFPLDVFAGIKRAYDGGHRVIELVVQSDPDIPYMRFYTKYYMDFNDMKQYNAYTNKTRNIKLIPATQLCPIMKGKLAKLKNIADVPNKENYSREVDAPAAVEETLEQKRTAECALILMYLNKTWLCYPADVLKMLQRSYINGAEIVEFVMLSDPNIPHMKFYTKYKIDFGEMVQMNSYTDKPRKIKLVSQKELDSNSVPFETAKGLIAKDGTAIKTIECDNTGKVELSELPAQGAKTNSPNNSGGKARVGRRTAPGKCGRLKQAPNFSRAPVEVSDQSSTGGGTAPGKAKRKSVGQRLQSPGATVSHVREKKTPPTQPSPRKFPTTSRKRTATVTVAGSTPPQRPTVTAVAGSPPPAHRRTVTRDISKHSKAAPARGKASPKVPVRVRKVKDVAIAV